MRPGKYESHVLPHIQRIGTWVKAGATALEVAGKLNVGYSTLRRYLELGQEGDPRYQALAEAFAQACQEPDDQVEAALFRSCQGYNTKVVKHYKLKLVEFDPDTGKRLREEEQLVAAADEIHVAANTAMQMFWLTNRRPGKWKYKRREEGADRQEEPTGVVLMPGPEPGSREEDGEGEGEA